MYINFLREDIEPVPLSLGPNENPESYYLSPTSKVMGGRSALDTDHAMGIRIERALQNAFFPGTEKWDETASGDENAQCSPSLASLASSPAHSLLAPALAFDANPTHLASPRDHLPNTHRHPFPMPKKRTSLQSILIPPFLLYPLPSPSSPTESRHSSSRVRSLSTSSHSDHQSPSSPAEFADSLAPARISPPPDFLLDDDPFANHTAAQPLQPLHSKPISPPRSRRTSLTKGTSIKQPRSPLAAEPPAVALPPTSPVQSTRPTPAFSRTSLPSPPPSGRQPRPAYTRPAFAPRPSLPSLRTLAQSDFIYPIKTRKGTLGARLPLEPWDLGSSSQDDRLSSASEEAPFQPNLGTTTDHHSSADLSLGPEAYTSVNEVASGDEHPSDAADACQPYRDIESHVLEDEVPFVQSPVELELDSEEGTPMFSSLFDVLTSFSSSSLSRSPSSSSSSSVPVLSPDSQTQWGDDSPARCSTHSSSGESVPADLSFDDDASHPVSKEYITDLRHSQSTDFLSMPGGYSKLDDFQPGTSAGTIRPPVNSVVSDDMPSPPSDDDWQSVYEDYGTPELEEADMFDDAVYDLDELVDGDGWESHNGRSGGGYQEHLPSSNGHENGGQDRQPPGGNESYGGGGYGGGEGRGGEGGGGDRRKDGRDGKTPSGSSTPSDSESEESEDEGTRRLAQDSQSAAPKPASSDDDDVPLARSIPTALRAQRTIRKQVRDENDERRRLRALQRQQAQLPRDEAQQHQAQIGVSPSRVPVPLAHSTSRAARPRTKTLPSNTARPVPADDLARRLRDIQVASHSPTSSPKNHLQALADPASAADQFGRLSGDHARAPSVGSQDRSLRPARSFHRPRTADPPLAPTPPPPYDPHRLGRSATTASRPTRQRDPFETNPPVTLPLRAKSIRRPRTSEDAHPAGRTSVEQRAPVPRASADVGGTGTGAASGFQVVSREAKPVSWQQRVFIVDLQRFNTLEMGPGTTAKEILETLDSQGQLANWAGAGGWMLFEVSQDFGMERPIRHYEVVSEIISSWDKDKSVNLLVAKKTPLAARLHPSAMPSSSPVCSGYIEWESKRGKWSKRWLELREQGLWLSKKDNGKDETFLCSLANFDAYVVTRLHKSPKPYVFAVKSTDNLTFFESAADYVHTFCCSEKDGLKWVESILLARSYFINQERNVLSATGGAGASLNKALSRSGTRKGASRAAQQPLVQVPSGSAAAPAGLAPQGYAFEPGSLLAKR